LRFLCDANIGSTIVRAIAAKGYDVVTAIAPGEPDQAVLERAVAEERILVTCDRDFGELIYLHGKAAPPAVIYIRFEPQTVEEIVPRLMSVLEFDMLRGHMIVIDDHQTRRRPLPGKTVENDRL